MDALLRARLEAVYAEHPLRADAILERVRKERGTLDGVRAHDLAVSAHGSGLTDQNHAGGAAGVRALANAVGLGRGSTVLDIGTGLGGTPRLLAEEFGCRCHGVELTSCRFEDAVRLTHAVGLAGLVAFSHGDFMTIDIPDGPFDVVIGQAAFMHFVDLQAALERAAAYVRPGGRLVVEDDVIRAEPSTPAERHALEEVLAQWNGRFQRQDDWPGLLERAGLSFDRMDDLTPIAVGEFETLLAQATAGELSDVMPGERHGWELARQLSRSGCLGTVRILATRSAPVASR